MATKTPKKTFFPSLFFCSKQTKDEMHSVLTKAFEKGFLKPWYVTAEKGAVVNHIALTAMTGLALCGRAGTWSSERNGAFTKAVCPVCMRRYAAPLRTYLRFRIEQEDVLAAVAAEGEARRSSFEAVREATSIRNSHRFVDSVVGL